MFGIFRRPGLRFACLSFLFVGEALAADLQRQIQVEKQTRMNPALLTKITVGDIEIQPGAGSVPQEFQAGGDWLEKTTIFLFNRTTRHIVAVTVSIGFPELGDGQAQPMPQHTIALGRIPAAIAIDGRSGKPLHQDHLRELLFAPGQTLVIHLADHLDRIREAVESRTNLSLITKAWVSSGSFYFEDGLQWGAGCYRTSLPGQPGVFRCIRDEEFFPGDPRSNWPPPAGRLRQ